ncbi:MAG TPA: Holliday junction branch migration protein RuvA [Gammaproteobacteria bacterium]|nr:Holliday junction branch migration protein RuvA [Gammaproteobacteria bacterium]
MIGRLQGRLIHKLPPMLLIDVQGVGYEVEAPMSTFYQLPEVGDEVNLYTHLVVRDDAHLLFGFASEDERHLFRTLIRVNGVGAKMALTILSGMEADDFARSIREGDTDRLTRLPGVGKKTAERLVVEMRDRLKDFLQTTAGDRPMTGAGSTAGNQIEEAISALISLGYKPQEASRYVHAVAAETMNSETIIREALKASVSK